MGGWGVDAVTSIFRVLHCRSLRPDGAMRRLQAAGLHDREAAVPGVRAELL